MFLRYRGRPVLRAPAVAVLTAALLARPAAADDEDDEPAYRYRADERAPHGAIGVGGFAALTGPLDNGPAVQVEFFPGGAFGRFGVRADYRGLDGGEPALLTAGVAYVGGATRPHLHLALHADAGVTVGATERSYAVGAGLQTQLWIIYPLAVGLDSTAHVLITDGSPELTLSSLLTVRASF